MCLAKNCTGTCNSFLYKKVIIILRVRLEIDVATRVIRVFLLFTLKGGVAVPVGRQLFAGAGAQVFWPCSGYVNSYIKSQKPLHFHTKI
jgi:hypothetical protein